MLNGLTEDEMLGVMWNDVAILRIVIIGVKRSGLESNGLNLINTNGLAWSKLILRKIVPGTELPRVQSGKMVSRRVALL